MPEINHKDQPAIQPLSAAQSVPKVASTLDVAKAFSDAGVTAETLEQQIEAILAKKRAEKVAAAQPGEPNWASLTEQQAMNPAMYIPVIEHDIPDYMNMKLRDAEYEVVWANRDQRRLGELLAQGYELLKKEHVHSEFKVPLLFDSEGNYVYQDVVALRVHKRILYSKRRRALDVTKAQLKNGNRPPKSRFTPEEEEIQFDPGMSLYEART